MAKKLLPKNVAETWSRPSDEVPRYGKLPNVFTSRTPTSSAGFLMLRGNASTAWTGPTDREDLGNQLIGRGEVWSAWC